MESQETNNLQAKTSAPVNTSDSTQSIPEECTDREASESKLDTSINVQEAQAELKNAPKTQDSCRASEQPEESINSPLNSDIDSQKEGKNHEPHVQKKEQLPAQIEKKGSWVSDIFGRSSVNVSIYNGLAKFYNHLCKNYEASPSNTLFGFIEDVKKALDLISRLESDKEKTRKELEDQDRILRSLKDENRQWEEHYKSIKRQLTNITADRDSFIRTRQSFETTYKQQTQELVRIQQEKEALERKLADSERSRDRLLAETASLKRNTGTHYDGTSDRPQHHVLTGEYKTLKEQYLDPLANSLFTFMAAIDPELKQQRKEKVNNIKAAISATVLIGGQAIMRGESTALVELPLGILEEIQTVLCQRLQLNNQALPPETTELLRKAVNLAQGNIQYPSPTQWKGEDFQHAHAELNDRLYQELKLNVASLSKELQTEVKNAIDNALLFLQRAAIAEPPASLSLDNEGASFRSDYHEAAKGWDDEGTVIKTIYPVYLVNGEAKVKAVVLTKPSDLMLSNASHSSTITDTLYSTQLESNSVETETNSIDINENKKEKMIRLEAKRESLINSVKAKWFKKQYYLNKNLECILIEKLSKIARIKIIEELEKEIHKAFDPNQFEKKLDELLAVSSSQQNNE